MKTPRSFTRRGLAMVEGWLRHLTPLEELKRGQDVNTYRGNADGPFCITAKTESRQDKQEDTCKDPGGISDDREEHKITMNLRTEYIGSYEQRVAKHKQC